MKVKIINTTNNESGEMELPDQFREEVRPDLIERAVLAAQRNRMRRYGSDPEAGKRVSAKLHRRRRHYRGSYGMGISRVPRKIMSRRGTRMNWVAALAPGTVGGRRAHPPKAEATREVKINTKERRKAIRSALAATMKKDLVTKRGHITPTNYPFIIEDSFEQIKTTKSAKEAIKAIGFDKEIERTHERHIRAGKGKARGRRYRTKKSILIVVSGKCPAQIAFRNVPGVDVASVKILGAEALAPGGMPGRATLFTQSAIKKINEEKLFT